MAEPNLFGTLTPINADAAYCGADAREITHAELDSITDAVRHQYGALAERAVARASSTTKATDRYYSEEQRAVLTDETAGASAGCGNPVGIAM